jgi:hypothetical protein
MTREAAFGFPAAARSAVEQRQTFSRTFPPATRRRDDDRSKYVGKTLRAANGVHRERGVPRDCRLPPRRRIQDGPSPRRLSLRRQRVRDPSHRQKKFENIVPREALRALAKPRDMTTSAAQIHDDLRIVWHGTRAPTSVVELAEAADAVFAATGDTRCKVAAGILRGNRVGRTMIPDRAALVEMSLLLDRREAASVAAAAKAVARTLQGEHSVEATATRLARKFRKETRATS